MIWTIQPSSHTSRQLRFDSESKIQPQQQREFMVIFRSTCNSEELFLELQQWPFLVHQTANCKHITIAIQVLTGCSWHKLQVLQCSWQLGK